MKRILLFIICISLILTGIIVRADESEQNAGLLKAALDGDLVTVQTLLDEGVDVSVKNEHGLTALTLASMVGNADVVQLLKNAGAKE